MENQTTVSAKYLTSKRGILNAPGYAYNQLYYNLTNSNVSAIESTCRVKGLHSLNSLNFGSVSNINLQNDNFIGTTWLELELPNLVANQTLCRGWGFACIDYVEILFGSSSTSLQLSGEAMFMMLMGQCHSSEMRSEIMRLAGDEYLGPALAPIGGDVPKIFACVPLALPFSALCHDRLMFPADLLSSNINVTIKFKNASAIYGGTGARPNGFVSAGLRYREENLSNKGLSFKFEMQANPIATYNYPFIHYRGFSKQFAGVKKSSGLSQIELNGFINSDLLGIFFYVVKSTDVNPTGNNSPSPFNTNDITNVTLKYNDEIIYDSRDKSYKLINLLANPVGAPYYENSVIRAGAVAPFNSDPVNNYVAFIDFTRIRSACQSASMDNTSRLSNQTVVLTLNTVTDDSYTMYACYVYNGLITLQSGISNIYFD